MSKLDDLDKKREEILNELKAINHKIEEEVKNLSFLKFKVKEGSIVKCNGKMAIVSRVEERFYDKKIYIPWLYVKKMKKDGTYGSREFCIYSNWELHSTEGE